MRFPLGCALPAFASHHIREEPLPTKPIITITSGALRWWLLNQVTDVECRGGGPIADRSSDHGWCHGQIEDQRWGPDLGHGWGHDHFLIESHSHGAIRIFKCCQFPILVRESSIVERNVT